MADDLLIKGHRRENVAPEDDFAELYGGQVRYEPRVHVTTQAGGARGSEDRIPLEGDDDDIVEVETADGFVSFTSVREARRVARSRGTRFVDDVIAPTRGASPVVDVRVVNFNPLKTEIREDLNLLRQPEAWARDRLGRLVLNEAARAAMVRVAAWLDKPVADSAPAEVRRKKAKSRGIYTIDADLRLEPADRLRTRELADLRVDKPVLVLLHGTFSHTEGAFGGLRGTPQWTELAHRYDDRMLALEHATLSQSPLENALDLLRQLPEGARLHLLSHSRGGLIGDVLSFAGAHVDANEEPDLSLFDRPPTTPVFGRSSVDPRRDQFHELLELSRQRGIRVERFARVACPANGTLLASRRIDRYASYLFNVLKLAPGLQGTGVVEAVKLLVLTFLDQRSDTMVLPGLEAQMPESPFIGTLNARAKVCADDGMGAVAGDVEGSGIVKRLKVLGADAFFLGDHDMVVNTRAMVGGVPRRLPRVATFRGSAYSHSNYFTDEATRTASLRWLTDADGDGKPETEFIDHLVPKRRWWGSQRGDRTTKHEESVLVVPDLLGSTIEIDDERVWPDPPGISRLGVEAFLASDRWKATGLVDRYDPLVAALEQTYVKVVPFPYDGRGTLADIARLLLEQIGTLLDDPDVPDPLHVVTHGAGGRILRVAQRLQPEVVARLGRRVLLSPPLAGSALLAARAAGRDPLTASLAVLAGTTAAEVGSWMDRDWLSLKELAVPEPPTEPDDPAWSDTTAVYGRALTTLAPGPATKSTRAGAATYHLSSAGDGHVPWPGPDSEPPARYLNTPFDELVSATAPLELVRALLTQEGDTRTGSTQRPVVRTDLSDAPAEYPALFPDPDDLVWRSMGAPRPAPEQDQLSVTVIHGNLTAAGERLIVGTQYGTPIGGAEKALDHRLEGALQRHRLVGQYPGPLGTCQLFVRPDMGEPGAAVIGLGDAGDITPGSLTAGIAQAVMRLVAARPDEAHHNPDDRYLDVATVLIGTTSLGGLNVASAVHAAITGVRRANRRILDLGLDTQVRRLRVYELYEDRANEALQAALRIRSDSDAAEANGLAITELLEEGVDGLPGNPPTTYSADRWRTIRVSTPKVATGAGSDQMDLFFNEIGRTAGAETLLSQGQRKIIDELIEGCVRTPYVDEQTYNTLYELVVPRPMKGQGRPSEHMMYLLDDNAAKLPFEMFATRSFDDRLIPTSTEVGIIRRLEVGQLATSTGSTGC